MGSEERQLSGAESIGAILSVWHQYRITHDGGGPEDLAMAHVERLLLDLGYLEVGGMWGRRFSAAGDKLYSSWIGGKGASGWLVQ